MFKVRQKISDCLTKWVYMNSFIVQSLFNEIKTLHQLILPFHCFVLVIVRENKLLNCFTTQAICKIRPSRKHHNGRDYVDFHGIFINVLWFNIVCSWPMFMRDLKLYFSVKYYDDINISLNTHHLIMYIFRHKF